MLAVVLANEIFHERISPIADVHPAAQCLQQRIQVHELSAEACWNDLLEHCASIESVATFAEANVPRCEILIERIAEDGEFANARQQKIHDLLENTNVKLEDASGWLVGAMMILAGRLKLRTAIPHLYRYYETDWDWFNEEITGSLVRIIAKAPPFLQIHAKQLPQSTTTPRERDETAHALAAAERNSKSAACLV